jgi:large subunit ribosomal protein MRP49
MDFAVKINDGHFGPRRFWHMYLPRLKYHNPAVSMTVNRTTNQLGPATMTIYFAPDVPKPDAGSTVNERTEVIDMKHKMEGEILRKFMEVTKAQEVKPTEEELEEMRGYAEQAEQGEKDRVRESLRLETMRREAALLSQARKSIVGAEA